MKIAVGSDLHLEFMGMDFELPDADVLILAGDILVIDDLRDVFDFSKNSFDARTFLRDISFKYKNVIYVPGNHEYYGGVFGTTKDKIVSFLKSENITNIEFSEYGSTIIDDVKFVYATLWTDINRGNPILLSMGSSIMNDYNQIMTTDLDVESGGRYLQPKDTVNKHFQHKEFIEKEVVGFDKVVVITHHSPSLLSSDRRHSNSDYFYCCTDMDLVILDNPQINYWIHGHLHNRVNYKIGETTVISNCRGYSPHEKMASSFKIEVIEV